MMRAPSPAVQAPVSAASVPTSAATETTIKAATDPTFLQQQRPSAIIVPASPFGVAGQCYPAASATGTVVQSLKQPPLSGRSVSVQDPRKRRRTSVVPIRNLELKAVVTPKPHDSLSSGGYGTTYMMRAGNLYIVQKTMVIHFGRHRRGQQKRRIYVPVTPMTHLAKRPDLKEKYAGNVKDFHPEPWTVAAQEFLVPRHVLHPNVVFLKATDLDEVEPLARLYMPYRRNILERIMVTVQPKASWNIAGQALHGLAALHAQWLVHGDMKLDNLLAWEWQHHTLVTIIDFSLACRIHGTKLRRAIFYGSVADLNDYRACPALKVAEYSTGKVPRWFGADMLERSATAHLMPGILNTAYHDCPANLYGHPFSFEIDTWALGIALVELHAGLHPDLIKYPSKNDSTGGKTSIVRVFWEKLCRVKPAEDPYWYRRELRPDLSDRAFLKAIVAEPDNVTLLSDRQCELFCDLLKRGQDAQLRPADLIAKYRHDWGEVTESLCANPNFALLNMDLDVASRPSPMKLTRTNKPECPSSTMSKFCYGAVPGTTTSPPSSATGGQRVTAASQLPPALSPEAHQQSQTLRHYHAKSAASRQQQHGSSPEQKVSETQQSQRQQQQQQQQQQQLSRKRGASVIEDARDPFDFTLSPATVTSPSLLFRRPFVLQTESGLLYAQQRGELHAQHAEEGHLILQFLARELYRNHIVSLEAIVTCAAWFRLVAPHVLHDHLHNSHQHLLMCIVKLYRSNYMGPRLLHAPSEAFAEFDARHVLRTPETYLTQFMPTRQTVLRCLFAHLEDLVDLDTATVWTLPDMLVADAAASSPPSPAGSSDSSESLRRQEALRELRLWMALFLVLFHPTPLSPAELVAKLAVFGEFRTLQHLSPTHRFILRGFLQFLALATADFIQLLPWYEETFASFSSSVDTAPTSPTSTTTTTTTKIDLLVAYQEGAAGLPHAPVSPFCRIFRSHERVTEDLLASAPH